jgi:DNA-binding NarL/FixJ family response regulator
MVRNNIRVLIVDDVPQVRLGLAIMLKLASRNITPQIEVIGEAQDGRDAITQAQLLQPDVILMDLEMPGLDGYAATRSIKSSHPSILIVALSIHADPACRQKVIQAGADAFVEKGGPLKDLFEAILSTPVPS